jgi:hypothetical protein
LEAMRHLDEHTIALYAMGGEFPLPEKGAIEAHLSECHGCRAQVQELRQVNQHVEEAVDSAEEASDELPLDALVPFPRAIRRRPDAPPARTAGRTLTRAGRFAALVRRHPIGAGSAGLMLAFLAFFSLTTVPHLLQKVDQPLFVRTNALGTALEVCGKDVKIFDIPVSLMGLPASERERNQSVCTRIVDLDGDGNMEIINGTPFEEGEKKIWNTVRIFDNEGKLLSRLPMGKPVRYNGVDYSGSFGISGLVVLPAAENGKKEILVGINNDRSPWCLVRLDSKGNTLGEYWHFGWLWGVTAIHLAGIDHELVLLSGANDTEYRSNNAYPALAVIDPSRVTGSTESECTRGFGFPPSDAELYYIRSGNVTPDLISGAGVESPSFGYAVKVGTDSSLIVSEGFCLPQNFPSVMYTFNNEMKLQNAWMPDMQRVELMRTFLVNKTAAGFDEFVKDMEKKVRYWDGSQWKAEPVKILRESLAP